LKKHPSGAKAHFDIAVFMYGLKPVPFKLKPVPFKLKPVPFKLKPVPFKLTHYQQVPEVAQ
jgi:hypothetical protein